MAVSGHDKVQNPGRRKFLLGALGGAWGALLVGVAIPVFKYLKPKSADPFAEAGKVKVLGITADQVAEPGQGANGGYASRPLIIFRDQGRQLKALDAQCTHAGCTAQFEGVKIACHCHGGVYDLTGKVVSGPPPHPLTPLKVVEENGELFVMRFES